MLNSLLAELAGLFRAHDEQGLADWIDHTTEGDAERLPQRVLQMFAHGMGGLMDRPLYSDGQLDVSATKRRDVLQMRFTSRPERGFTRKGCAHGDAGDCAGRYQIEEHPGSA
jgi:hypothetical protein